MKMLASDGVEIEVRGWGAEAGLAHDMRIAKTAKR